MESVQCDIWNFINDFFKENFSDRNDRLENEQEAYWCRNKELFCPEQRIFARLIKSYQNTTWHQVQLSITQDKKADIRANKNRRVLITDHWFENSDIIKTAHEEIETHKDKKEFVKFCNEAINIVKELKLKEYKFNEEQTGNFDQLEDAVSKIFNDRKKELKVSSFEEIIYEKVQPPYKTIMKMQKLLPGLGIALVCDFLKESHLCNIAKPDVHISHVFSLIDGITYSMDLPLVKRVSEFAAEVCPADPNDFCNSGAYNVDKIIWMICSDYNVESDNKKKNLKVKFLEELAKKREELAARNE